MRFKSMEYLDWAKLKAKAGLNLCRSSVENFSLKDLDINWDELEITGYNPYGYPPLIREIASRYGVNPENVATTLGTSHALFLVCAAMLAPGEVVLVEKPAYEPLLAVPEALGAKIQRFERKFENSYQLSLVDFESAISKGSKLVLLTNLHNPSGTWLSPETIKEIAAIARKNEASLVLDEIYLEFLDGEKDRTSFLLAENVIVISSLTKVYGLGGLRCGWVLGPPELVSEVNNIVNYLNVEGVLLGEQVSVRVFNRLNDIRHKNSKQIKFNLNLVKKFIESEEMLSWIEPAGGVVCFPRIKEPFTGDRLAEILRVEYDTCVVPGRFFESSQHFRLSYGLQKDILTQGLINIRHALKKLEKCD